MSDMEKLSALRVGKADSNLHVRPIDLLRAAAHDVEVGETKCDGVLVLFVIKKPDGRVMDIESLRAGLPWEDELLALQLELHRCTARQFRETP
jgi:hypothetical protein